MVGERPKPQYPLEANHAQAVEAPPGASIVLGMVARASGEVFESDRIMRQETNSQRVVVVSNRLPVTLKRVGDGWQTRKTSGGLATAMQPMLQQTNGIWIGWSGETSDTNDEKRLTIVNDLAKQDRYFAVHLDA